jgi:hypothetical protein
VVVGAALPLPTLLMPMLPMLPMLPMPAWLVRMARMVSPLLF